MHYIQEGYCPSEEYNFALVEENVLTIREVRLDLKTRVENVVLQLDDSSDEFNKHCRSKIEFLEEQIKKKKTGACKSYGTTCRILRACG